MKMNLTETHSDEETDMHLSILKKGSPDWIIIVFCILVGALIAFAFSFLKSPIYEATASVTTNLQLSKGGSVNEFMLDSQINHIGELFYNGKVVDELIAREAKQGLTLKLEDLKESAIIERRMLNTLIKVQHTDPVIAARIASNWAEILYETLLEAYPIAVELSTAKNTLSLLENCANPPEGFELDAFCGSMTKAEYDKALSEAKAVIIANDKESLGLSEYLNVSQYQVASVPSKPISYNRGTMVLAGAAIGLTVALIYFVVRKKNA